MKLSRKLILLIISIPLAISLNAQNASSLSIKEIMKGSTFVGNSPQNVRWSPDGKDIYFNWNPHQLPESELYKTSARGSEPIRVLESGRKKLPTSKGNYNKDYSKMLYSSYGDIFLWEASSNSIQQLTYTVENESNPAFSQDGNTMIFQKGGNLFSWDLVNSQFKQLTDFRYGVKKEERKLKTNEQWLQDDQLEFFRILRERKNEREYRDSLREIREPKRPLTIYTGKARAIRLKISPDERFVSYTRYYSARGKRTDVPDFVTETAYTRNLSSRPKVGSAVSRGDLWIYDRERDTTYQIDSKNIPGIKQKPLYLKDYIPKDSTWNPDYEKERLVDINGPFYNEDGSNAALVIRSQDHKDRWIMLLDLFTGKLELLDRQRDEAWIGGPGIGSYGGSGVIGWLADNESLYFQSEVSGYSHLYTINVKTRERKALTSGKYEIRMAQLSRDKQHFYLMTNERHPGERHLYKLNIENGEQEQISSMTGGYEFSISPDEAHIAFLYSNSTNPWELYVMPNKAGASAKKITESQTKGFKAYSWREPEIVTFKAEDGADVYARLFKAENQVEKGPAVIFVHGAGYKQNAHKYWSSYYREYMFHNFLVDNGYTVLDIDFRASDGYGRDWRTAIYRHMGGKDLSDQIDGVKYLIEEQGVDPERIGMYGGSYGGFITLMALFKHPGVFQCGAALRSVTDWAHYNHVYTSNILNTPVEDSIAFRQSSPLYFAEGLKDHLLMLHGMVDTNVQFQDVVRLSQRLIELEKENWELAVFPMEGHGFVEASSWVEEYKRIFKLFETHLK